MNLTTEQIAYLYDQPWDDDVRQDVIVKMLEYEGEVEHFMTWASTVYRNELDSQRTKAARRIELAMERVNDLHQLHGQDDVDDPIQYVEMELMYQRVDDLSPLLAQTMELLLVEGLNPQEVADKLGLEPNTVYQRIWQAKKEIQDGR